MGWIARGIWRSLKRAEAEIKEEYNDLNRDQMIEKVGKPQGLRAIDEYGTPLNIQVFKATGGHIVRCNTYSRELDENNETTYIIPTEENFTEALVKMINMEMMKR
jgi:hypothetical protein